MTRVASASITASLRRQLLVEMATRSRRIPRCRVEGFNNADPHRVGGIVKYGDIIESVTMKEQLDERTGSREGHPESKDADRPAHRPQGRTGQTQEAPGQQPEARYFLPVGRTSRSSTATRSTPVTSSPRSRARPPRPRTSPVVCRASPSSSRRAGQRNTPSSRDRRMVWFGKDTKGKRKVVITPESVSAR